ncbi:MAG: hypothetical protein ACYTG3_03080 [Planctomycetota bacterium]|jgi:hypothetical protein
MAVQEIHPAALRVADKIRHWIRFRFLFSFFGTVMSNRTRDDLACEIARELRLAELERALREARDHTDGVARDRIDAALALVEV